MDGLNLVPYLTGKNPDSPHETMYWRYGEQWAVRQGDWKLVVSKSGSGKPELYNLAKDIGESTDLATGDPKRAAEMQKLFDAWSAQQAEPTVRDVKPENGAKNALKKNVRKKNPNPTN